MMRRSIAENRAKVQDAEVGVFVVVHSFRRKRDRTRQEEGGVGLELNDPRFPTDYKSKLERRVESFDEPSARREERGEKGLGSGRRKVWEEVDVGRWR